MALIKNKTKANANVDTIYVSRNKPGALEKGDCENTLTKLDR